MLRGLSGVRVSWPLDKTPVSVQMLCQQSEFLDKIHNSFVDSALTCYFTFYLGCGFPVNLVLFDASLTLGSSSLWCNALGTVSPKQWILQFTCTFCRANVPNTSEQRWGKRPLCNNLNRHAINLCPRMYPDEWDCPVCWLHTLTTIICLHFWIK